MGLLDNIGGLLGTSMEDPRTAATLQLAQGLLGGGGSMQRLAGGLQGYGGVMAQARQAEEEKKRRALQEQMLMQQVAEAKAQADERARQRAAEDGFRKTLVSPQMQASQAALAGGGGPTLQNAARMPQVPQQDQLLFNAMQAGLVKPLDYMAATRKENTPIKLGAGESLLDPRTLKPLASNPKEDSTPSAIKEYNFAKSQGYPGTFQQFQLEQRRAGASQQTVTVGAEKAFATELAKLDAKQLDTMRDAAEKSRAAIGVVQNLRTADAQGAYSGGFADQKLAAARLINGLTGATPKGLVGSELYNAEASKLVVESIKQLGANPSNADLQFIQKTIPQLSTSPVARKAMADFMEAKANGTISVYKKANEFARKNNGLSGFEGVPEATGGEWSITPVPGR